ncbi:MAG: L,D-transpeptidase family protein [Gammaproteobacteria bacterium]
MRLTHTVLSLWVLSGLSLGSLGAKADTYIVPSNGDNVVGALGLASTEHEDTLSDLARAYNMGFWEIRLANPAVDAWLPGAGTEVVVPSQYILPKAPREGIVVNVPEMRLYYYPRPRAREAGVVITYPISVGRQDWSTPQVLTKVMSKQKDPAWYPPESIRAEHAADGDPLPKIVRPGPDNPLGEYALRLGISGYLIHGTNKPYGIGMRVTHGCLRLYPRDIASLFAQVNVGTPVRILNQPYKLGRANGLVYFEAHPLLEEDRANLDQHRAAIDAELYQLGAYDIDWNALQGALQVANGMPVMVGALPSPALGQKTAKN